MKLKFGFFLTLMTAAVIVTNAQGGFRRTVEERVQVVHAKMDSAFKLGTENQAKVDSAFANYYRQQDKIREEMRSGGERPNFQALREKMQPALEARDKELKTLLTDEQFKKWKEEIEPAMMPRRGAANRQ